MNIVLIGFMGAGKSSIASLLAERLSMQKIEMDDLVLKESGRESINDIFEKDGELYFRQLEVEVARKLGAKDNAVVSCGGGVVMNKIILDYLKKNSKVVFLDSSFDTIFERLKDDDSRPLFKDKSKAKELYDFRLPLYKRYADIEVITDNQSPDEIANKIISKLKLLEEYSFFSTLRCGSGMRISAKTKICMIIGDPVEHSLSPKMHNAAYKVLGIDDKFVFLAARVKKESLADAVRAALVLGIRGLTCTIPHKVEVMRYLDKIDDVAQKIGAVNTVVNDDGLLTGYNTDWLGAIIPLEKLIDLKGKKVALIGAGGSARAIGFGLIEKGARLKIYNRTFEEARVLAETFGCESAGLDEIEELKSVDIVVNATPVGMKPYENETLIPINFLHEQQIVFDVVYVPYETRLLREAKSKGARIIHGMDMLLYQGTAQFEYYTGYKAPEKTMRESLMSHLCQV